MYACVYIYIYIYTCYHYQVFYLEQLIPIIEQHIYIYIYIERDIFIPSYLYYSKQILNYSKPGASPSVPLSSYKG